MPDIRIHRDHTLGLAQARQLAIRWGQMAQEKFGLQCRYQQGGEGGEADTLSFTRAGVKGALTVTADRFELHAHLGFLLGAFKERIEGEIVKNLDALLAEPSAPAAAAAAARPAGRARKQA